APARTNTQSSMHTTGSPVSVPLLDSSPDDVALVVTVPPLIVLVPSADELGLPLGSPETLPEKSPTEGSPSVDEPELSIAAPSPHATASTKRTKRCFCTVR